VPAPENEWICLSVPPFILSREGGRLIYRVGDIGSKEGGRSDVARVWIYMSQKGGCFKETKEILDVSEEGKTVTNKKKGSVNHVHEMKRGFLVIMTGSRGD